MSARTRAGRVRHRVRPQTDGEVAKLDSILAVVPSARRLTPAVHRAAEYARRSSAVLHLNLFDCYPPIDWSQKWFGPEVAGRARRDFIDEHLRWLCAQAAGLADQGLRVECEVIWAPVRHDAILAQIQRTKADLVVEDVPADPNSGGTLLPSASDWKLLRLCPVPMMLVSPPARLLPSRLVAAVDIQAEAGGSLFNDRIFAVARQFAALSEAELHLTSIFAYLPIDTFGAGFIADTWEMMNRSHQEALDAFGQLQRLPAGRIHRRQAFDAAEGIAEVAGQIEADLVVIGSAYRSAFDRLLLGATAEGLLRRLRCDVLLVKPEGFHAQSPDTGT